LPTIASLVAAHCTGARSPEQTVRECYARIRAHDDPAVFITLRGEEDVCAEARALVRDGARPLLGVPVAVKDNMDMAGVPTTVGCPAFAYKPGKDASVVARLKRAGAIVIGKTNLDQFATGLVGVRSPYGIPRNALRADLIPGGSSSGSAVAVAAGLVPLALGTDTAGSGRVPAGFNNIVGLKPSPGLVPNAGVVPACRSLDCVSIFTLTVDDAFAALAALAGPDPADAYSRALPLSAPGAVAPGTKLGVPLPGQRLFFGDEVSGAAYEEALARFARLGLAIEQIDIEPFYETARLLYEGPWLAERYLTARAVIASAPDEMHPVTREIILGGARTSAAEAFAAFHQLEELRRTADATFHAVDALALPTMPTVYTVKQVLADPIQLNTRLGTYTNFVNLLGLCGLAVPAALRVDGAPFGITLVAPGGRDAELASIGRLFHADTGLPLGATGAAQPPLAPATPAPQRDEIALAVVGAHLSGMPLNAELKALGARFLQATATAPDYRLFALAGTKPPKPGLLRIGSGQGGAVDIELWALSPAAFGRFVAAVPPPLSIGTLRLADGREAKGFLVEAEATAGARDITRFGGWRAYVKEMEVVA
jgi:allophanate hydrolase